MQALFIIARVSSQSKSLEIHNYFEEKFKHTSTRLYGEHNVWEGHKLLGDHNIVSQLQIQTCSQATQV